MAGPDMEVGDCFDDRATSGSDNLEPVSVACEDLHEAEIYATRSRSIAELPPLETQRLDEETVYCRSEFESFVGMRYEDSKYEFSIIWRDADLDVLGERRIACVITLPDLTPIRGSLEGAGE